MGATQAGMILGTAALHGARAGARQAGRTSAPTSGRSAWCCTRCSPGGRLFEGDDVSTTLAAVIKDEPTWDGVPANVQRLLKSCLEKDPQRRLRDIGDAWRLAGRDAATRASTREDFAAVADRRGGRGGRRARGVLYPLSRAAARRGSDALPDRAAREPALCSVRS